MVVTDPNLFGFFYDRVQQSAAQRGCSLAEHTEFYLVSLLVDFLRTRKLVQSGGQRVDDRPLAIRLLENALGDPRARTRELKHLADSTLYRLGFFAGSLTRRSAVDRDYYANVGMSAYRHLAVLTGSGFGREADPVFSELGERFEECVDLLADVKEDSKEVTDSDVLALYERWLATGDPSIAKRLRAHGIGLDAGGDSSH
ncbi:MAG: hypothetical protein KDA24_14525 [Deltaproteobacteria bacterium]|nr:hypothetical protein [Deltaproteobacteria bacterium]